MDVRALALDDVRAPDESTSLAVARLMKWMRWWGPKRAEVMMTDLNFERAVKRAVVKGIV